MEVEIARSDLPALLDHIGWDLFRAFAVWKNLFARKMSDRGCVWVSEARGALLQHIGPGGISQNMLVEKSGLTKQAVQQHLDDLTHDGILERVPDKQDARRKRVQLTPKGLESQIIANEVKMEIEAELRQMIGATRFEALVHALREIAEHSR